jgi:hypothetical protein
MAKKLVIQNNYLLYFENESNNLPTSVFSRKNTIFNFNIDRGFDLIENTDGKISISISEVNSGGVVGEKDDAFDLETLFEFLTRTTAMYSFSDENVKVVS